MDATHSAKTVLWFITRTVVASAFILSTLFPIPINIPVALGQAPTTKVGLVTDVGGVSDLSFNWMAYQGLQQAEADLGVVGTVYESFSSDDYVPLLQQCADDGNDLCFAVGFSMADAIITAANANPGTAFAILDYWWDSPSANLRGIWFDEKEVGYLAGALAGKMTGSNVVGVVGGAEIPPVIEFVEGYRNGAQCANPDVNVLINYTGTFTDPGLGAAAAQDMIDQGANVIFGAAGATGNGAILNSAQQGIWSIGVDSDQYLTVFGNGTVSGSDKMLTSAMKNLDYAVHQTTEDYINGSFSSGTVTYHLADGGVGLAPYHETAASVPQPIKDYVDGVKADIIIGNIDVNGTCRPDSLPNPNFNVWLSWSGIHVYNWTPDTPVTLTVDDPSTPLSPDYTETKTSGPAPWDPGTIGLEYNLNGLWSFQPGTVVTVTDGSVTKTHTIAAITVDQADLEAETVWGTAPAGMRVDVNNWPGDARRHTVADSSGHWFADFSVLGSEWDEQTVADLQPGSSISAIAIDEDGDGTGFDWRIPNPYIELNPVNRWAHAREWPTGALITMTVDDPVNGPGVDFTATATMGQAPWNPGDPNDIAADFNLGSFQLQPASSSQ